MQSDSDEATAKPSEPVWAGWALPVDADDKLLLSISTYASDVLAFATAFLARCGFVKMQRLAPTAIASESFISLKDRSKIAVEDGFVRERFTWDIEKKLNACGVIPSYTNQFMQQLGRIIITTCHAGLGGVLKNLLLALTLSEWALKL